MDNENLECEYCQVVIEPDDELVEYEGMDFCSDSCLEMWQEENERV